MPAIENTVLNRLKVIFSQDYSSGFSGYDLSGAGSVVIGSIDLAPVIPCCCVVFVDTIIRTGRSMGFYQGDIRFQIVAYTGGSTLEDKVSNALNLAADLSKAITSDRSLGLSGTIEDCVISRTALSGEEIGVPGVGVALCALTITFSNEFGV